ncbi:MAG: 4Fe-4S binding protein, partial [Clostridia bacterium]|nr:4Fe-4S binding protein [Clostridia bacterium]
QTSVPDIFVGGDVYHGPSFVINAIGEGHEAAESLHRYVRPTCDTLTIGREHRHFFEFDKNDIMVESYDNSKRQKPELVTGIDKAKTFDEYVQCFTEEQVKIETARCLSCGASVVDPVACIGCGVCTTKCSFDAIHLERTHPHRSDMLRCEDSDHAILLGYAPKRLKHIAELNIKKAISKITD